tara:strand:- start:61814 stop:61951 length:138 start_codon:yes stop_codon:yes gene_type:complete
MKKIRDKWYFGAIIIPVILNYLTNYIKIPVIFENWEYLKIKNIDI